MARVCPQIIRGRMLTAKADAQPQFRKAPKSLPDISDAAMGPLSLPRILQGLPEASQNMPAVPASHPCSLLLHRDWSQQVPWVGASRASSLELPHGILVDKVGHGHVVSRPGSGTAKSQD